MKRLTLIACVLGVWAAYALSGAGVLQPLPLLAFVLTAITAVYRCEGSLHWRCSSSTGGG